MGIFRKVHLPVLLSACVLFCSCGEECGIEKSKTLAGSVNFTLEGDCGLWINGEETDAGRIPAMIGLYRVSDDEVEIHVFLYDETHRMEVHVGDRIKLTGKPYDVRFDYEGIAPSVWIGKTEHTGVGVKIEGWMKRGLPQQTRCSPYIGFQCDIKLEFTVGEDEYVINIAPHISWG